jgi:hypothetical protein
MLTKKQFDVLFGEFKKALPKGTIPDYNEYVESENMFEDYLDIFRGINTRMERSGSSNIKWYYDHPFFNGDKLKLEKKPCIRYVMIGEARPKPNEPVINNCGGDENNTYFYNVTNVKNTRWLSEPCRAFNPLLTRPSCPNQKAALLLDLASKGYVLIDLFPFAITFTSSIRKRMNDLGITNFFYSNYLDPILTALCKLTCHDEKKPIVAFSGSAITHHYLMHQIANGILTLNPCFSIYATPNYFIAPLVSPALLPPTLINWLPLPNALNGIYPNIGLKQSPFYRAECWDASFSGPHFLFIRNAFDL